MKIIFGGFCDLEGLSHYETTTTLQSRKSHEVDMKARLRLKLVTRLGALDACS